MRSSPLSLPARKIGWRPSITFSNTLALKASKLRRNLRCRRLCRPIGAPSEALLRFAQAYRRMQESGLARAVRRADHTAGAKTEINSPAVSCPAQRQVLRSSKGVFTCASLAVPASRPQRRRPKASRRTQPCSAPCLCLPTAHEQEMTGTHADERGDHTHRNCCARARRGVGQQQQRTACKAGSNTRRCPALAARGGTPGRWLMAPVHGERRRYRGDHTDRARRMRHAHAGRARSASRRHVETRRRQVTASAITSTSRQDRAAESPISQNSMPRSLASGAGWHQGNERAPACGHDHR